MFVPHNLLFQFREDSDVLIAFCLFHHPSEVGLVRAAADDAHEGAFSTRRDLLGHQIWLKPHSSKHHSSPNALDLQMNVGLQSS